MGPKVTVDAATMANKGLELIEARWLFDLRPDQCAAVQHTQSKIHALVEFCDGSILAQLGPPSMTFPIQHALLYPERAPIGTDAALPLDQPFSLDFRPVDETRYPCLGLARGAMTAGGTAPAVFNAANEVAVAAFLAGQVPFLAISRIVAHTLSCLPTVEPNSLAEVLAADQEARAIATRFTTQLT
jgi:1-deoxy-D-xylulose-5-phosphate reductoisomerase